MLYGNCKQFTFKADKKGIACKGIIILGIIKADLIDT